MVTLSYEKNHLMDRRPELNLFKYFNSFDGQLNPRRIQTMVTEAHLSPLSVMFREFCLYLFYYPVFFHVNISDCLVIVNLVSSCIVSVFVLLISSPFLLFS